MVQYGTILLYIYIDIYIVIIIVPELLYIVITNIYIYIQ